MSLDIIINDNILKEAYDHEVELYEFAREEGKLDVAKEMKKQGFSLE